MLLLLLIDRFLNLTQSSIQTRKILELAPVFLTVPAGYALSLLYRWITRRAIRLRSVFLGLAAVFILVYADSHTDLTKNVMYTEAFKARPPVNGIAAIESVDYRGKVFLTDRRLEAAYLPFYYFTGHWGPAAHTASRFHERLSFLLSLETLSDPRQVAFLLKKNRFDPVDYFFLPHDSTGRVAYFDVYPLYYPANTVKLTLAFPFATTTDSPLFTKKHNLGLYDISLPESSVIDIFAPHDTAASLDKRLEQFNRLRSAVRYLPEPYADSLRPLPAGYREKIDDSIDLGPDFTLGDNITLHDFRVTRDNSGQSMINLLFSVEKHILRKSRIFLHAYPENPILLPPADRSRGFTNLDFDPAPPTDHWSFGQYILCRRPLPLRPGSYRFHVGFFNDYRGRLEPTWWSPTVDITGP